MITKSAMTVPELNGRPIELVKKTSAVAKNVSV